MSKRGRYKCEGICALPGEISKFAFVLPASRGAGMNLEESAAVILGTGDHVPRTKPNVKL